jgi:nucleotide-binding universal stress UspA family protein
MSADPSPCIVVGYDGSRASVAAVAIAAERAREGGRVVVVHAFQEPVGRYGTPAFQRRLDAELDRADRLIADLLDAVPALAEVSWEPDVIGRPPAEALQAAAEARHATEIVLGTRGLGRARALLGSVAHDLLHVAHCPVTVIPARAVERDDAMAEAGAATSA